MSSASAISNRVSSDNVQSLNCADKRKILVDLFCNDKHNAPEQVDANGKHPGESGFCYEADKQ